MENYAKRRIYEICGLPLEEDESSVINFVEWYRELWASWQTKGEHQDDTCTKER